jgi:hypothetical protein
MAQKDDTSYFSERAATEHRIAERCANPTVASTHRRFAQEYERRLDVVLSSPRDVSGS